MRACYALGLIAVVAAGCASAEAAGMRSDNEVVIQPLAGEGATTAARSPLSDPLCAGAARAAGGLASAEPLDRCIRGSLAATTDGHYFMFYPTADVSYRVDLARSGDARFDLGLVSAADGRETCTPLATALVSTRVKVNGASRVLCVVVRSQHRDAQDFALTLTR